MTPAAGPDSRAVNRSTLPSPSGSTALSYSSRHGPSVECQVYPRSGRTVSTIIGVAPGEKNALVAPDQPSPTRRSAASTEAPWGDHTGQLSTSTNKSWTVAGFADDWSSVTITPGVWHTGRGGKSLDAKRYSPRRYTAAVNERTIFFGSIGVLAETSDIQRWAYNTAMAEAGLGWSWDPDTYRRLLTMSGGRSRLRLLADATGTELTDEQIAAIHARKTELACAEVVERSTPLRPGVAAVIRRALDEGVALGLVTSTYRPNVDAIAEAAGDDLPLDRFATVITTDDVEHGKPAPDAYLRAIEQSGADPATTVAIEDTATSVLAARGAGLRVIAVPGELSSGQVLVGAELVVTSLGSDDHINGDVAGVLFG